MTDKIVLPPLTGQPIAYMALDQMRAITQRELNSITEENGRRERCQALYPIPLQPVAFDHKAGLPMALPPVAADETHNAERIKKLEERVAELEKALDSAEIENGITYDGNLWRFWSEKAKALAKENAELKKDRAAKKESEG